MKKDGVYLYEEVRNRENRAIDLFVSRRLEGLRSLPRLAHFEVSNLLVGLRIPYQYLSNSAPKGDIDLILLPQFQLNSDLGSTSMDNIPTAAFEVKVCYLSQDDTLKSSGLSSDYKGEFRIASKQKRAWWQAKLLCESGFDVVSILYLCATEPVETLSRGFPSWVLAGNRADLAVSLVRERLRYVDSMPFGTLLVGMGAVPGGSEFKRGSQSYPEVISEPRNEILDGIEIKLALIEKITIAYSHWRHPFNVEPDLIRACSRNQCKSLYLTASHDSQLCPACGAVPY